MESYLQIVNTVNPPTEASLNIVFMHGLDGHHKDTWTAKNGDFWPNWFAEDINSLNVFSIGYDAASQSIINSGLNLHERAINILELLRLDLPICVPTIYIGHSMGGLVLKEMIMFANSSEHQDYKDFLKNIKHVVFLATPHNGSDLASFVKKYLKFYFPNKSINTLEKSSEHLMSLNSFFKNYVASNYIGEEDKFITIYYEKLKTKGLFMVVDKSSSDIGLSRVHPKPIEENHIEIAKLSDKSKSLVYKHILKIAGELLIEKELSPSVQCVESNESDEVSIGLENNAASFFYHLSSIGEDEELLMNLTQPENFLTDIVKFIDKCDSMRPLTIHGFVGSGKSWFISELYNHFKLSYDRGLTCKLPINVDLAIVEHGGYYCGKVTDYVTEIEHTIKNANSTEVVFFIDGIDTQRSESIDIAKDFLNECDRQIGVCKTVIGVGGCKISIADRRTEVDRGCEYRLFNNCDAVVSIVLKTIPSKNDQILAPAVESYLLATNKEKNISSKDLVSLIKKLNLEYVDPFTLNLLIKRYGRSPSKVKKIEFKELVESYIFGELGIKKNQLDEIAEKTYAYLVNKRFDLILEDAGLRRVVMSHNSVRDYLVSRYVVNKFICGEIPEDVINKVFTYEINLFAKQIINESIDSQSLLINTAKDKINSLDSGTLVHLVYCLGRVSHDSKRRAARIILNDFINSEKGRELNCSDDQIDLLLLRSVEISLIVLGDENASRRYVTRVIRDKLWNNLNRGFHLEYYGDLHYAFDKDNLIAKDKISEDFPMTYLRLSRKIQNALIIQTKYPLFELDLVTICSLTLHRMSEGELREVENYHINLTELVQEVLKVFRFAEFNELRGFLKGALDYLPKGNKFTPLSPILNIYKLKTHLRSGWSRFSKDRGANGRIESVAEHTAGCLITAEMLLPEKSDIPYLLRDEEALDRDFGEYSKETIIAMLLVHDWGEWKDGDIPTPDKTHAMKVSEQEEMLKLSMLRGFTSCYPSLLQAALHREMEKKETVNARVAGDLDLLESLIQLCIYWDRFPAEKHEERKTMYTDIKSRFMTRLGELWLSYLERQFDLKI